MAYRVLIADDEEIIRQGIEFLVDWERAGLLDCRAVRQRPGGHPLFGAVPPPGVDIIISDIRMAGADAWTSPRYVSQNQIPVQVIFLTAYADFSYAKNRYRIFCNRFCAEKRHLRGAAPGRGESQGSSRPKAGGAEKEAGRRKAEPSEPALSSGEPAAERGAWHGARAYDNLKDEEPYCVVTFEVTDSPQACPVLRSGFYG